VVVTLIGTYIIITLFIVILLDRFAGQDDTKFEMEDMAERLRKTLPRYGGLVAARCSTGDLLCRAFSMSGAVRRALR
jgi:hypothetical protein